MHRRNSSDGAVAASWGKRSPSSLRPPARNAIRCRRSQTKAHPDSASAGGDPGSGGSHLAPSSCHQGCRTRRRPQVGKRGRSPPGMRSARRDLPESARRGPGRSRLSTDGVTVGRPPLHLYERGHVSRRVVCAGDRSQSAAVGTLQWSLSLWVTRIASTRGTSAEAIGHVDHDGHAETSRRGSTMIVVPRLLIKNPAIPSHRRVVPPLAANADLLKVRVSGALAWYLFSIVAA
jgi:hypothetical protein